LSIFLFIPTLCQRGTQRFCGEPVRQTPVHMATSKKIRSCTNFSRYSRRFVRSNYYLHELCLKTTGEAYLRARERFRLKYLDGGSTLLWEVGLLVTARSWLSPGSATGPVANKRASRSEQLAPAPAYHNLRHRSG
jgi:hypothetical protein